MTERDAAWMARIMARIQRPQIEAMAAAAELPRALHDELVRVMEGRRRKILARYLSRLSPLADVTLGDAGDVLCARDLARDNGLAPSARRFTVRAWSGPALAPAPPPALSLRAPGQPCVHVGELQTQGGEREYWVLELSIHDGAGEPARGPGPLRVHLYRTAGRFSLVGIERPEASESHG